MPNITTASESPRLLISKREAATALNLSVRKVEYLLLEPDPPPHIRIGRCIKFPVEALQAWVQRRTIGGAR
ncbi:MAG: helix-turn-helix transcriptional regulator [Limisphaerales bacterium]